MADLEDAPSTVYVHDPDDDAVVVDDGTPYADDLDFDDEDADDFDPATFDDGWTCDE